MDIKACTKCGAKKPPEDFYTKRKGGISSQCRACTRERSAQYWRANNEELRRKARTRRQANVERERQRDRDRYKSRRHAVLAYQQQYRVGHRDAILRRLAIWKSNNPDTIKAHIQLRRARKQKSRGAFTGAQWRDLQERHGRRCVRCGASAADVKLTPDHIFPLSRGGANSIDNIQPLCLQCNVWKRAKYIDYRHTRATMTIYIAGPMTGIDGFNYPAFHRAAARLRSCGLTVINPAEMFDGDTTLPRETYLRADIHVITDSARALVALPGWQHSEGAKGEIVIARMLGLPVYAYSDGDPMLSEIPA